MEEYLIGDELEAPISPPVSSTTMVQTDWAIGRLDGPNSKVEECLTKLLIEKGVITQAEFMQKLSDERATYQAMVGKMG